MIPAKRAQSWSRKEALASAEPLDAWPSVDFELGASPDDKTKSRNQMLANRIKAIQMFSQGKTYRDIQAVTGQNRAMVRILFKRCLEIAGDGRIQGYRALLPYVHLRSNARRNTVREKRPEQQGGMSCALAAILARFPDMEGKLVDQLKRDRRNKPAQYHPTGTNLVRIFHGALRREKVTDEEWPFRTKHQGRHTIVPYMRSLFRQSFSCAVGHEGGPEAKAHAATGRGPASIIPYAEPFDAVEIDAYKIDAFFSIAFQTPAATLTEVTLRRLWLLAAVERMTTAVLAYSVVYASEVRATDVAALIRKAIVEVWHPKNLTVPLLAYPPGSGLPSGVIPEAAHAVWSVTMLDGALANLACRIHDFVRRSTGFVINWGPPGHFERRPNVERTFAKIAMNVFQRFPSTTGSGHGDGRAPDAEVAAGRFKIRADEAEQLVDVHFAEHNAVAGERNYYNTPLEAMRQFLCGDSPRCMVRTLPPNIGGLPRLALRTEVVTVRGAIRSGRRPYIQLENVRYTNPLLADSAWLLGKQIVIHIDDEDLRQVRAFLTSGEEYGVLVARGKWGVTKHDLTTRRAIFSLAHRRILQLCQTDDPVQTYLDWLAVKAKANTKRQAPAPKEATEAARVARDAGVNPRLGDGSTKRKPDLRIEPIVESLKLTVMPPLPDDFFTTKKRLNNR
ncbi:conserved hypothetical protein [Paraburkholderia piptadeniae]|uniref:Integrase catalytic region n=1 Tax=Paraburkholderia piptadeniae TaxID=1701573 RepID=A0A1N7SPV2_9BURK|nr:hypothetical protein [Paraburkholderia piptadeniae]SIT49459.1 conserved hypothetical protein [Paraburkholderia piptadeniae]